MADETPKADAKVKMVKVRANVNMHGLAPGEEGEVPDGDEVRAQIESGMLEKA